MSEYPAIRTAAELRREFDEAFSRPVEFKEEVTEGVLAIVASGRRIAVKIREIRSIHLCPKITRMPSSAGACEGIAAIRGRMVGVYDLAALLGYGKSAALKRWVLLVGDRSIGLIFDDLAGFHRLPEQAIRQVEGAGGIEQLVQLGDASYAFANIPALVRQIENLPGNDAG